MSVVVLPTRCRLTDMMLVEINIMLPTWCWFTDTVSVVRHGVGLPTLGQSGSNISKRRMNDLINVIWKLRIFKRIRCFDLSTTLCEIKTCIYRLKFVFQSLFNKLSLNNLSLFGIKFGVHFICSIQLLLVLFNISHLLLCIMGGIILGFVIICVRAALFPQKLTLKVIMQGIKKCILDGVLRFENSLVPFVFICKPFCNL